MLANPASTSGASCIVTSKHEALTQCCFNAGRGQRQWVNNKTTMGQRLLPDVGPRLGVLTILLPVLCLLVSDDASYVWRGVYCVSIY